MKVQRVGNAVVEQAINDRLRPMPVPDELTRPFWDAVKDGRLAIQRCQSCGTYYHPPVVHCYECESRRLSFENVSGRGTIYTFLRVYETNEVAFSSALPYVVAYVELVEQPWLLLMANLAGAEPSKLTVGAHVQVAFVDIGDGAMLPDFRLVDGDS